MEIIDDNYDKSPILTSLTKKLHSMYMIGYLLLSSKYEKINKILLFLFFLFR